MGSLAQAVIVGNITRDPESIADGRGCSLGLAVNQRIKKGDEWEEHASFFDVVVWGKQAESCERYLSRGSLIAVDAEIRQERWEKDGNKRSAVKFVARSVQFLDRKSDDSGAGNGGGSAPAQEPTGFVPANTPAADDDIPF